MTDAEKLKTLLDHWIEHNIAHKDEFERWGQRAREAGLEEVSRDISAAVGKLQEANECLRKALARM